MVRLIPDAIVQPGAGGIVQTAPLAQASDAFTDADTTVLTAHIPTGGGTWTAVTGNGAGDATIDAGRVHNTNDTTLHSYAHSWAPSSPNYDVECDVVMRSDNNLANAGVIGRASTGAHTYYHARYTTNGDAWQLIAYAAGTGTQLGSGVSQTLVVDQAYRLVLRMRGTTITLIVDGVPRILQLDGTITAAGRAGVRFQEASAAATGPHLDNWRAVSS
jgi:hypothetical protein